MQAQSATLWELVRSLLGNERRKACAAAIAVVLLANAPYLLGFADPNPLLTISGLGRDGAQTVPGLPSLDPNAGFVSQADGHRAAIDWLRGRLPWWNPYEAAGNPLAAAMVSGALFMPFELLLIFSDGQVVLYALLDLIAALATFWLLSALGLQPWACFLGAVLFGLNGTNAWFHYGADNPVAFLPVILLGLEQARRTAVAGKRGGWRLLAVGVAFIILAGFPETALLEGLLALLWGLVRMRDLTPDQRIKVISRSGLAVVVGLCLAAPLIIAFLDVLPHAVIGMHSGSGYGRQSLPYQGLFTTLSPYALGPTVGFSGSPALSSLWSSLGGYLTAGSALLALIAVAGRPFRLLRSTLGIVAVAFLARNFGFPPARILFNLVPGFSESIVYRYDNPIIELSIAVLAAFAVDDALNRRIGRRRLTCGVLAVLGLGIVAVAVAAPVEHEIHGPHARLWWAGSLLFSALIVALVAVGLMTARRAAVFGVIGIVAVEAAVLFAVPDLATPRSATVDTAAVTYLRQHVGTGRFFSYGPFTSNYGAYFGVPSADVNDLPVLKSYASYDVHDLAPNGEAVTFNGVNQQVENGPSPLDQLPEHLAGYRNLAIDYLVVPGVTPLPALPPGTATLSYQDHLMSIYRLNGALPFAQTSEGCQLRSGSLTTDIVSCDASGGTLLRRETMTPGWHARSNGHDLRIRSTAAGFQLVTLPLGASKVTFSYAPPFEPAGWILFSAALLFVIFEPIVRRVKHRYIIT